MHNIDQTTREFEFAGEFEFENEFAGELEYENETEAYEFEQATELLGVQNEYELDQFLGNLISKAAKGISKFAGSPIGQGIIGGLKSVAKQALPGVAGALGNMIVPGVGGMIGSKVGSMASNLFEMELEGLSNEDREFEVARRFVRFANSSARHAARIADPRVKPNIIVSQAIKRAAMSHAPGLLRKRRATTRPAYYGYGPTMNIAQPVNPWVQNPQMPYITQDSVDWNQPEQLQYPTQPSGTWERRGNSIVIFGV